VERDTLCTSKTILSMLLKVKLFKYDLHGL
jgi:hypothetical protein